VYSENLFSNKMENLEEMDKFLDSNGLPKLIQEDINHLNKSVTNNQNETVIEFTKKEFGIGWIHCLILPDI
jgi:hypothetical protein